MCVCVVCVCLPGGGQQLTTLCVKLALHASCANQVVSHSDSRLLTAPNCAH